MMEITATELARNLRKMLDRVEFKGEELRVVRNSHPIAKIVPSPGRQTALEAMADLYRTLPEPAAAGWLEDSSSEKHGVTGAGTLRELRDPWDS